MRLHLVDGTYELFRAHFSKRPDHRDPGGRGRKATVGVVWSMLGLLRDPDERVTHVAVAFDRPIRSFRNDLFDGYKTDAGVPPELLDQFVPVEEAMNALGIVVWSMNEWEADDALATAADRWWKDVEQVRILTPDKDLGQCLRGASVVQVDRMRKRVIDEAGLLAARGVAPASVPDYLALVGDAADGIPGIPGFGEKTAATLLRAYGHIEHIPARAADWQVTVRGADTLAKCLADNVEQAFLYRRLATLVRTVPISQSLDDLRWRGVPPLAFEAWSDRIGAGDGLRAQATGTPSPPDTGSPDANTGRLGPSDDPSGPRIPD
jgi:5'-3' exonuclease